MRFSIRDMIWLTLVVGLILGWWLFWQSLPAADARAVGNVSVGGSPLENGRVYFLSASGQILGSTVTEGSFGLQRIPAGSYSVEIEGNGVARRYGQGGLLNVTVRAGRNDLRFDLMP